MTERWNADDLITATTELFAAAGHDRPIAAAIAGILVDADLMGFTTHGLQFVPTYLRELETGRAERTGEPAVLGDRGGALLLDGRHLPGQWVVLRALDRALDRLPAHGQVTVTVRDSRNVGCLATYMRRVAERGLFGILASSSPDSAVVAPFGGREGRLSTNPIGFAIPAEPTPILIDTSAAAATNRMCERARNEGRPLAGPYLVDADGVPTDDVAAFFGEPRGAILPAGGLDQGYKGFALGLVIEALTAGLGGFGRADAAGSGGHALCLMLVDPDALGGRDGFVRQMSHLAEACRATPPMQGHERVRLPGDRALASRAEALRSGVALHPGIMDRLRPLFERYGVAEPAPVTH
jgi:LDH2 family malate/lactate/ureidoglycolate dehydrogenase